MTLSVAVTVPGAECAMPGGGATLPSTRLKDNVKQKTISITSILRILMKFR